VYGGPLAPDGSAPEKEIAMLIPRLVLAAVAASVLASSAIAAPPILRTAARHDSKDHTPLLEQCDAYQREFTRAAAQQPPSAALGEAERLDREGVRYCDMYGTHTTQGANEIAEALHMIGVQPTL
jgi:hypothetical protein